MNARIDIVIPTWNRKDLIEECLVSLGQQEFTDFHVIVVDDGSTDGTAEFLAEAFPEVQLVSLPQNRGFCVAVNAGLAASNAPLVLLLNNDVILEPKFLAKLAKAADKSDTHLFAPLVLWKDEPERIYSAGDRQCRNGRPESIGFRELLEDFDFSEKPFGVSAGAGLYRREVFETVGVFDERFIAYFEDSDLNFRARFAGFDVQFVRDAIAYHRGGASLGGRTWWRSKQCFRNHGLLVLKNMPFRLMVRHAPRIVAERFRQMGRLVSGARTEFGLLRALGILFASGLSIIALLPHAIAARLAFRPKRRRSWREIDALMANCRE
jgi:GT2 family glycosyltransferase